MISTRSGLKTVVTGEQRTGYCEKCGTRTEKQFYMDSNRRRVRMACPECGGMGKLIVRTYSVQAPKPPQCVKAKCLFKFFYDVLFCSVLSTYHNKRVQYATHNRHKEIKEKYRTGNPSPKNIRQAILAIMKLKIDKLRR